MNSVRVLAARFDGAQDQGGDRPAETETALGLAVCFPGYGMTGCGSAGGDLLKFVNDAVVVAFAGQPGRHALGGGAIAGDHR